MGGGGWSPKKFFWPFGPQAQFGLKMKGGGGGLFGPVRFCIKSDLEQCIVEYQDLQSFSLSYNIFGNN